MFLQYFYFSPCLSSFFFFFIRIIRIHPKMKNSRVFDNCFLPINIASRVIILKAVSNSKKKKKTLKNNYREILFSNRFVSLSLIRSSKQRKYLQSFNYFSKLNIALRRVYCPIFRKINEISSVK